MKQNKEVWMLDEHPITHPRNIKERDKLRKTIRPGWSNCASAAELMKVVTMSVNKEPYERQPYVAPFIARNDAYMEDAKAEIIRRNPISLEDKHERKTRKVVSDAEARGLVWNATTSKFEQ